MAKKDHKKTVDTNDALLQNTAETVGRKDEQDNRTGKKNWKK